MSGSFFLLVLAESSFRIETDAGQNFWFLEAEC